MFKLFKNCKGNILAVTAISMFAIVLMMSFAIDVSQVLTARNQLQVAADAAALAGASGLITSQSLARSRAISFAAKNNCLNNGVNIGAGNISFPTASIPL